MISSQNVYRQGQGEAAIYSKGGLDLAQLARDAYSERRRQRDERNQSLAAIDGSQVPDAWQQDMDGYVAKWNDAKKSVRDRIISGEITPSMAQSTLAKETEELLRDMRYSREARAKYDASLKAIMTSAVDKYDKEEGLAQLEAYKTGKLNGESIVPEGVSLTEWRLQNENLLVPPEGYDDVKYTKALLSASKIEDGIEPSGIRYSKTPSGKDVREIETRRVVSPEPYMNLFEKELALSSNSRRSRKWVESRYQEADAALGLKTDPYTGAVVATKNTNNAKAIEETGKKIYGRLPETPQEWVEATWVSRMMTEKGHGQTVKYSHGVSGEPSSGWGFGSETSPESLLGIEEIDFSLGNYNKRQKAAGLENESSSQKEINLQDVPVYTIGKNNEVKVSKDNTSVILNGRITTAPIAKKDFVVYDENLGKEVKIQKGSIISDPDYISQGGKENVEYTSIVTGIKRQTVRGVNIDEISYVESRNAKSNVIVNQPEKERAKTKVKFDYFDMEAADLNKTLGNSKIKKAPAPYQENKVNAKEID